jgi:hypothetical protein
MTDDSTREPDSAQPQEPTAPWGPPTVDPVVSEAAPGTAPAAWTAQTAPGEAPTASYGQRFRRRFWVTLLVVAGLEVILAVINLLGARGEENTRGNAYLVGTAVGAVLGMVVLTLVVTLFVALVPGPPRLDARSGLPSSSRVKPWAVLAVLVAAPIFTYAAFHVPPVPIATIASPKDGCHAFLDATVAIVRPEMTEAGLTTAMQSLYDAALEHDPMLAADVKPLITDHTSAASSTASEAIIGRCLTSGDLTKTEVTDWVARLKARLATISG